MDVSTPIARQLELFELVYHLVTRDYAFKDKAAVQDHFTRMTGLIKNLNYAAHSSAEHKDLLHQIDKLDQEISEVVLTD